GHQDLRERAGIADRDAPDAQRTGGRRRTRGTASGRRGNPPILELDRSGDFARGPLQEHRGGVATTGALAVDFRHARSRGHAGRADDYRLDERRAVLPPAPAGPLDEFALLDGPQHGTQILAHHACPPAPARGRTALLWLPG